MSLYSALFPYRPRINRSSETRDEKRDRKPLEDFLTHALVDLLNRLTDEEKKTAVDELFLDKNSRADWEEFFKDREIGRLTWTAQKDLDGAGRCDMILEEEGRALLIIEAKIYGSVGRSREPESISDRESDSRYAGGQLERYGQWLAEKCKVEKCKHRKWPGALTFLTHMTPVPETFRYGAKEKYGIKFLHTCRWSDVFLWLRKLSARNSESMAKLSHLVAYSLAAELAEFLKEKSLNTETITFENLSAAEKFIGTEEHHAQHIVDSFELIRGRLKRQLLHLTNGEKGCRDYFSKSDNAVIRDFVYLAEPKNWSLEWGLCWPSSSWHAELKRSKVRVPEDVFWYVTVFSNEIKNAKTVLNGLKELPTSWTKWKNTVECGVVTVRAASEFLGEGNIDRVADWMDGQLKSFQPVAAEMRVQRRATQKRRTTKRNSPRKTRSKS